MGWKRLPQRRALKWSWVWSEPLWDGNINFWRKVFKGIKFDPNHCGMETHVDNEKDRPFLVWSEPLWDGNLYSLEISTSKLVWSEPLWDGNEKEKVKIFGDYIVWSEPLWDGNEKGLESLELFDVWSEPLWDGNKPALKIFRLLFMFDPNHCGMETLALTIVWLIFTSLIRTIVGWKRFGFK